MKQATLFSLKSWKKVAVEDIAKYKDILDNQNEMEAILKTLITLKKKNPTKELVLSTGIDSSLKRIMVNHSSPIVTNEVKKLIIHWKLEEISSKNQNIIDVSKKHSRPESNLENNSNNIKEAYAVCKKSESLTMTNTKCVPKPQPMDEVSIVKVCAKLEEKNAEVCKTPPVVHKGLKANTAKQLCKIQTPKQICKKPSINDLRKSEVNRRLQFAMQLFMEEVGKQEVKMYLEASA